MTDLKKVAEAFSSHMLAKFGASLQPKEEALEMKAIAWGMDIGRFLGVSGVASSENFMTKVSTTLGKTIYMPATHRNDPLLFIEILTHECQHVVQFGESQINFSWLYLTEAEARVKYEADAYAAGAAIEQWMTGSLTTETAAGIVASLVAGYHLRQQDADLAEDILKSHFASLKRGVIMTASAREAIAFLNANFPSLKGTV